MSVSNNRSHTVELRRCSRAEQADEIDFSECMWLIHGTLTIYSFLIVHLVCSFLDVEITDVRLPL